MKIHKHHDMPSLSVVKEVMWCVYARDTIKVDVCCRNYKLLGVVSRRALMHTSDDETARDMFEAFTTQHISHFFYNSS